MITKTWTSFLLFIRQISRDFMLILLCVAPFLAGMLFKFGIPVLEKILCRYFEKAMIIEPYYFLFDWMLVMLAGMLYSFVGALVMLGEIDEQIARYSAVTPLGNSGYLFARLGYPSVIAMGINCLILALFHISDIKIGMAVILILTTSLSGVMVSLLVVAISSNKVEGMAVGKLSGLVMMGIFIPVVIHTNVQYIFSVLPSFWLGKFLLSEKPLFFIGFAVVYGIWIVALYRSFCKKIREGL